MMELADPSVAQEPGQSRRRAIVMISVGTRPWLDCARACFERYGKMHGIEFFVENAYPPDSEFPLPVLPDQPGRRHKLAYALKAFFAWKYLAVHGFDQVMVVDDTCCIRPTAPDPFPLVPLDHWGFTRTNKRVAQFSFDFIKEFTEKTGAPEVAFNTSEYMNSGVMIYGAQTAEAISPEKIIACSDLLFARTPHQTLSYYLMKRAGVPSILLPKSFNVVPGVSTLSLRERKDLKNILPLLTDEIFISHITGTHLHRDILMRQIAEKYLSEFDQLDEKAGVRIEG